MVEYEYTDLDQIIFELKNSKALICKTDTINGILAMKSDIIFKIKKRILTKKIVIFIPNLKYIKKINSDILKLSQTFWPGKLTIIYNKISYRIPDNKFLLDLLREIGPLYCSSANLSGFPTPKNTINAYNKFINKKHLIVINDDSDSETSSTIYNVNTKKIIREGKIKLEEIRKCLK